MKSIAILILTLSLRTVCAVRHGERLVPLLALSNGHSLPSTVASYDDMDSVLTQVDIDELSVAVVMKANTLSFDDIAKYGGVYGENNAPLASLQDFFLSSVSSLSAGISGAPASELTSTLSFAMDAKPITINDVAVLSVLLQKSGTHLVVIQLPEGNNEDTFKTHNSMLAEVKALLDQLTTKYTIFYTSDRSSVKPHPLKRSVPRQYTQQASQSPLCYEVVNEYNSSCIVFCFTSRYILYVIKNSSIQLGIGEEGIRYEGGSCNSTGNLPEELQTNTTFAFIMFRVEGNVTEGEEPVTKSLIFAFENGTCGSNGNDAVGCGSWTMKLFAGDAPHEATEYRRNRPDKNIFTKFSIPKSISYSCGNCLLNKFVPASAAVGNDSYQLGGIHVQAFTQSKFDQNNDLVFDSVYQCQGYTDMPSWMGVVSVLLLLLLLYVSYVITFGVQSPDTFDDPRAPTISVENLH